VTIKIEKAPEYHVRRKAGEIVVETNHSLKAHLSISCIHPWRSTADPGEQRRTKYIRITAVAVMDKLRRERQ